MLCREYVDLLSSDRLQESDSHTQQDASEHVRACHYCQAFTKNQIWMNKMFARYREHNKDFKLD